MQLSVIAATLEGCPFDVLEDAEGISRLVSAAVDAGHLTLLHQYVHKFSPQGVTASAVLAESHIAVHTWPECGLLFIDIATCAGEAATRAAFDSIRAQVPHTSMQHRQWLITSDGRPRAPTSPATLTT